MRSQRTATRVSKPRTNVLTLPNSATAIWLSEMQRNSTLPFLNLDELPRQFRDFRIEVRMGRGDHLCDVEEKKAEEALSAMDGAIDTLRAVLDELFRKEDGGDSARKN